MPGESRQLIVEQPTTTIDLSSATDNVKLLIVPFACTVLRAGVTVVAATTVTAFVVDFDRRVTPGSDTGRIDQGVARITAPVAAQAAGRSVYKDVQVDLNPGDEITVQVVTAASAGSGVPWMEVVARAASLSDFSDMVASS